MPQERKSINKRDDILKIISESFPLLSCEDKEVADSLHELSNELNMKIRLLIFSNEQDKQRKYIFEYRPKSAGAGFVIFSIRLRVEDGIEKAAFEIKFSLNNIDAYRPMVEICPNKIKDVILNKDKRQYFEKLTADECKLLRNLVVEEYNFLTANAKTK